MDISTKHNTFRLLGSLAALSDGTGNAHIEVYDGTQPAAGAAVTTQVLLTTFTLDDPPGTIVGDQLVLTASIVALIVATGVPTWARWLDGNGDWFGDSTASATGGAGEVQVEVSGTGDLLLGGGCALTSAVLT